MRPVAALWLLTGLLALRVVGQALVAFLEVGFLIVFHWVLAAYIFVWSEK